jgi:hypothetical protein
MVEGFEHPTAPSSLRGLLLEVIVVMVMLMVTDTADTSRAAADSIATSTQRVFNS